MDLGLRGKVALVAGGSSGLGLAAARELAAEGAHVTIGARDPARLAAAERELREVASGRVAAIRADVTDPAAAHGLVDQVAAGSGALHIVVISGASPPTGPASGFGLADYQAAIDTVLFPVIALSLAALPHLTAARWGRLLYVASETAAVPIAPLALSGVTRGAVVRFAQALAAETAPDGITVNVLAPGATRTPMVERAAARLGGQDRAEETLAAMGQPTAVGRIGRPAEFAATAAFLASERASFITGMVHLIDGGASVRGPDHPLYAAAPRRTFA